MRRFFPFLVGNDGKFLKETEIAIRRSITSVTPLRVYLDFKRIVSSDNSNSLEKCLQTTFAAFQLDFDKNCSLNSLFRSFKSVWISKMILEILLTCILTVKQNSPTQDNNFPASRFILCQGLSLVFWKDLRFHNHKKLSSSEKVHEEDWNIFIVCHIKCPAKYQRNEMIFNLDAK